MATGNINNNGVLRRLSDFFEPFTYGWLILLFLFLQILFNVVVFPYFLPASAVPGGTVPVLDLMYGFSPERAYAILAGYGAEGRAKILFIGTVVDTIYPVVYTLFNILAITYVLKRALPANSKWKMLNLMPLITLILDLIENRGIAAMIYSFPTKNVQVAHLTSAANISKWTFAGICSMIIITGLVMWGIKIAWKRGQE